MATTSVEQGQTFECYIYDSSSNTVGLNITNGDDYQVGRIDLGPTTADPGAELTTDGTTWTTGYSSVVEKSIVYSDELVTVYFLSITNDDGKMVGKFEVETKLLDNKAIPPIGELIALYQRHPKALDSVMKKLNIKTTKNE